MRWRTLAWLVLVAWSVLPSGSSAQTGFRHVHPTDPTCGGHSPCYATIQAAVDAAQPGEHVVIQAGTHVGQVNVTGKNNTASATEGDRIVIEADPAAPFGSVVLDGSVNQCTNGHAVEFQQSKFITLRGLTITSAGGAAVSLMGGNNQNRAIHLERLRIVGNGSPECNGGITIAGGNPDTIIVNSLIHGNGRNGIATIDATGGPHHIVNNTIHGNEWSGVNITRTHDAFLVNNIITGNGTASGSTGGRFGVTRESSTTPQPAGIHLLNNLICGNRLGEINGPALDGTDTGNLTPTGAEGPGVSASPGCGTLADIFVDAPNDFQLATDSPALDSGMDPRTLGLSPLFNPLFETDFSGVPSVRPKNATGAPTARFDMGAFEADVADAIAPVVTFVRPEPSQHVSGVVAVEVLATDDGSAVASVTLAVEGQGLTTTLSPSVPPPAPSVTATASWMTTGFPDGAHTITATATDEAGNPGTATRVAIVDNTRPETLIDSGPTGEIAVTSAIFTFSGTDNLTPAGNLVFASRLDGGPWTAFSSATTAGFTGLAEGPHTFEVTARDLAGNEDLTPATRTFTVRLGPSITNVAPASAAIGTFVTITGTNFEAGATTVTFNGLAAAIRTISPTVITTTVPIGARTGPLVVLTSRGSASRTFTVTLTGDFTLTASPATVRTIAGDQGAAHVAVTSGGTFTSLVAPSIAPAVTGITATFGAPAIAPGASTPLTFRVDASVAAGTYIFTVTGASSIDGGTVSHTAPVSLEVLPPDTHAVTGRIMTAESIPQPIPGVSVALGSAFVLTDAAGNFILQAPPPGPNMLFVDGRTASVPDAQFPIVEVQISVASSGPTRVPFTIYLPKLDTGNAINLPLDAAGFTTQEVKATTPRIPGLEVTIPHGTRIIGPDGNPVAQLVITAVPVDRSPMPFPPGKSAPMLFAINPGGAVPSQPLPISFPNITEAAPGTKADMYYFDLAIGTWNIWGTGTVSADGRQVVSDPGTGLPRLAWHWWDILRDKLRRLWKLVTGGDPVDLATGVFSIDRTDLALPARLPISIQRAYRSDDTRVGFFGIGWNLGLYDSRLTSTGTTLNLITADQNVLQLRPDGVGRWISSDSTLTGAVVTQLAGEFNFQIRYKDGTVHRYDRIVGFTNTAGLTAITDRNSNTVTITRSSSGPGLFGLITQITEPTGRFFTLAYDTAGRITSITDPIGRLVRYTYDTAGHLATVTDPAGGVTTYAYDTQHRLVSITDPRNIPFLTNEYDTAGRVIRQTQADGGVFTFDYVVEGPAITATTVTDPRGNPTTHRFDTARLPLSTTDALGQTTTFEYTPGSNRLLASTDLLGRTTRFTYDAAGNILSTTDAANQTRTFTYDPSFNRVRTATDPLLHTTEFRYDAVGNLRTIVDPRGKETTLDYNGFGQLVRVTDPLLQAVQFEYDALGNLAAVVDPLGRRSTLAYDAASRLIRQVTALGQATVLAYDALNQVRQIADSIGGVTAMSYDPNGTLRSVTDARGSVTSYEPDTMDRIVTRTDPLSRLEGYGYDGNGNVTRVTDRKGQVTTSTYDPLNRMVDAAYQDGSQKRNTYDAGGRLVQVVDSMGGTIVLAYDALDRLLTEATAQGTVTYTYDEVGRRRTMTATEQAPIAYDYDEADRLTSITQAASTVTFAYDDANRRTRLTLPNGITTDYAYDLASQLTALTYKRGAVTLGDIIYTYDAGGRRQSVGGSWARTGLPQAVPTATYDAANQQGVFGDQLLSYDANGNLLHDGTSGYAWDARNRLVGITGPTPAAFFYDALGRRVGRTVGGTSTAYLHDGLNVIQEHTTAGLTAILAGLGIDEHLIRTHPGGIEAILADALGSTVALMDGDGQIATEYTYESFGTTIAAGQPTGNGFTYTGREDDATGLKYYRARYYHPGLQRFVSEDPIGLEGSPNNLYAYVDNNPTAHTDPTGLVLILDNLPRWHPCVNALFGRKSVLASLGSDLACSIAFTPPAGTLAGPRFVPSSLGRPGAGRGVLEFPGHTVGRDRVFEQLKQGGKPYTPPRGSYPGELYKLPDGTIVGSRPGSNGTPTIDLNLGGKGNIELKFPPGF